jgi:flavin reductase (DIM6/NTAB) family NADH-FMN oxidoreductase RutF
MECTDITFAQFSLPPFRTWKDDWLLLAAGDLRTNDWNCMTVDWGCLGILWGRPAALILVRPSRRTYQFAERHDSFTLSGFPPSYREMLSRFGPHVGFEGSRGEAPGLTPTSSRIVSAPSFTEAEPVVECRRAYHDDLDPRNFAGDWIVHKYPNGDFHRTYVGEILGVSGTPRYRLPD